MNGSYLNILTHSIETSLRLLYKQCLVYIPGEFLKEMFEQIAIVILTQDMIYVPSRNLVSVV